MNEQNDNHRFDPEILRQLGRIDLIARAIVQGVQWGKHRSRRRGFSTEFSEFRPYTTGDDARVMDWRLYARTDRLYIKCFEAETCLEVYLLLDATPSMAWRWRDTVTKLEYGVNLQAALACLHMTQHDPVALLLYDGKDLQCLPPRCRRAHLDDMFACLATIQPGHAAALPFLIRALGKERRRRGRVIVCSDLLENEQELTAALASLVGAGDECVLLHLLDRAEIDLPFDGATHVQDSETGAVVPMDLHSIRTRHGERIRTFREQWRQRCVDGGIQYVPVSTEMSYVDVIRTLLDERRRS